MSPDVAAATRQFVARQLAAEFESGTAVRAAFDKLRGVIGREHHWALDEAETVFSGVAPPRSLEVAAKLVIATRDRGGSAERAFAAYTRSADALRPALAEALVAATSFAAYVGGLLLIMIIVVTIYALLVFPQFTQMFAIMGAELPELTSLMVGTPWILIPTLLVVAGVAVGYIILLKRLRARLATLEPLTPALGRLPGLQGWAAGHDADLWLRYFGVFVDAGLRGADAHAAASHLSAEPAEKDPRSSFLESADRLGRLREELAAQLDASRAGTLRRFERLRDSSALVLRVVVYAIVASYLLAMYLPIFKLGAIV